MTAIELLKSKTCGPESLILIIDDAAARRVTAAWAMLGPHNIDRRLRKKDTLNSVASELWTKAHALFSLQDLADQADVPVSRCERIFFRLIIAGIVYPDGTISRHATDLLAGHVMAHIRGIVPKGKSHARA